MPIMPGAAGEAGPVRPPPVPAYWMKTLLMLCWPLPAFLTLRK